MYDVIGIDMPCVDLNVNVQTFPRVNGGEQVRQSSWQGGGKVASGMVAAARLGAGGCMLGAVGDDNYGRFVLRDFQRHGIETKHMKVRKWETTSFSLVLSDYETQGRSIVYQLGSAPRLSPREIEPEQIAGCKYLFVASTDDAVLRAMQIARQAGVKVMMDADTYSEPLGGLIPQIDLFIASEFVYRELFSDEAYEKNCRSIQALGPEVVVFTFGERGCAGVSQEGFFQLPAFKVTVRDTVGAGDVYHGAFLAGLLSGRTVMETARLASAVSAIKCTRIGGRAGIPDMRTAERFLKDGTIDYTEIDQRVAFYQRGLENV